MATYKVIQDIEAEDKLLGPLSLRQFIYAAFVLVMAFIAFKLATVTPLFVIPFLPPMVFFGLLASPLGGAQSTEVWLLARIRFFLKPRRRIWNQDGAQELVTITVPKKVEKHLTDGLSQTEVKSRLQALANTIDSRGWAVKNINVNLSSQPAYLVTGADDSDRLIEASNLPQDVPMYDVLAADDMLDETNNLTAQHLDAMINQSEQAHRQTLLATAQGKPGPTQPVDYWFMNQPDPATIKPGYSAFTGRPTITPGAAPTQDSQVPDTGAAEQELLEQIHSRSSRPNPAYGHMKVLDPHGTAGLPAPATPVSDTTAQDANSQATLARLASNDDLNISTIAREAHKATDKPPDDEVVISLR